jgi:hypothetical protein
MVFRVILFMWEFLIDVLAVSMLSDEEKELELLLLRQQLRIVERKQALGPQLARWQKVPLFPENAIHDKCLLDSRLLFCSFPIRNSFKLIQITGR